MTWADDFVRFAAAQITDRERDILNGRGVSDEQIEQFGVGYVNRRLPPLEGADEFLSWAQQGAKLPDMFVFPLTTVQGTIKGLQFRHVDRGKKGYVDYFIVQDEPIMFGLAQSMPHIWETGDAFLVEGVFDLFPLQRHCPAIFATMGAKVTPAIVRLLRRLARRVWIGYDMDRSGRGAAYEFVREHGREFEAHVVNYPKIYKVGSKELIKDPGDLWEAWGDVRVRAFLSSIKEP